MKTNIYDVKGNIVGEIELSKEIFAAAENESIVHEAIRAYLANRRSGTASTKRRGEVSGGGRKPWRQKGTGRARHGSIRSPLWRGGGVVFGPKPRSYRIDLPRKVKRLSLCSILSSKFSQGKIKIIDKFSLERPKTSIFIKILDNLKITKPLIVLDHLDRSVLLSSSNIQGADVVLSSEVNTYDVISHEDILFTLDGLKGFEKRVLAHG